MNRTSPPRPDLADYVAIALCPVLIMILVGSLAFFLIEVFYQGDYGARLLYIMGLFVIGAVLIDRIAIEDGSAKAVVFALALGGVMLLACNRFVTFEGSMRSLSWLINAMLLGIIWVCIHKLVWDCTMIDESQDAVGEGLLQTAGLDVPGRIKKGTAPKKPTPGSTAPEGTSALSRFWDAVTGARTTHTPGLWVVYFSLLALPLFGLGQWLIPSGEAGRRTYVFALLVLYVGSALGLLLTTSFLGLRRYLRQRGLQMPGSMAAMWCASGAALIAIVLAVCAALPRPAAEYSLARLPFQITSPEREANQQAVGEEGIEDSDTPGEAQESERTSESENEAEGAGESSGQEGGQQAGQGQGEPSQSQGESSSGSDEQSPASDSSSDSEQQESQGAPSDGGEPAQSDEQAAEQSSDSSTSGEPDSETPAPQNMQFEFDHEGPLSILKWIWYGILAIVALVLAWRFRREVIAGLVGLWQEIMALLSGLFGGRRAADDQADNEAAKAARVPARPFASFRDPFAGGRSSGYPPEELVRYSFEALEAWAHDHGVPRRVDQTPHEFAGMLSTHFAEMRSELSLMAELYGRVAYAGEKPDTAQVAHLAKLWQKMAATAPQRQLTPIDG
ncbi:MAG: DUF4129 domain-containing protein [Pirellulales bacterium]